MQLIHDPRKGGVGRHAPAMIDRRVLQRVSGRVASRLWDACLPLTLKKRRGMDEISFKEAAGKAGLSAAQAHDERLPGVVRHLKKTS
ncbi:hypothetical protein LGN17_16585 [Burkholderia sp. AU30280]|uniref:hypothetical protein n=1 Tax=Burkholderia sp. AU30280 TaxID=2879628 RepID=UPI001CF1C212|nr:hypothetical protein [Burkholderia sp. AU30280]MCA8274109.1 hypothetical protein [Burkholderia sp. AU30280]